MESSHNNTKSLCYYIYMYYKPTLSLGGAAVTEEIVAGYKFSRASYVLSLLRPQIFQDLELKKHGLKVETIDPTLVWFNTGGILCIKIFKNKE